MALVDTLKTRLAKYEAALDAALTAESYGISGHQVQRAKVAELQKQIDLLQARISRLENGSGTTEVIARFVPATSGGN
jgi:hypothetical protein